MPQVAQTSSTNFAIEICKAEDVEEWIHKNPLFMARFWFIVNWTTGVEFI